MSDFPSNDRDALRSLVAALRAARHVSPSLFGRCAINACEEPRTDAVTGGATCLAQQYTEVAVLLACLKLRILISFDKLYLPMLENLTSLCPTEALRKVRVLATLHPSPNDEASGGAEVAWAALEAAAQVEDAILLSTDDLTRRAVQLRVPLSEHFPYTPVSDSALAKA